MDWTVLESIAARAPGIEELRLHRLELVEARRRRRAGLPVGEELERARRLAGADALGVPLALARAREAYDGRIVVMKGPEVALDYPYPDTRPFGDLDLLVDDAERAQAALRSAGFKETGDPAVYDGIHHLRPLWWPGLSLTLELHTSVKWPAGRVAPPVEELLELAVASRVGVDGVETLPAAAHAIVIAGHGWAHQPLGRVGNLVDYAVTAARAPEAELRALAERWDCRRLQRATAATAAAVLSGGSSGAMRVWARHLTAARERTVLEAHLKDWLGPWWLMPRGRAAGATLRAVAADARRTDGERWAPKLRRTGLALGRAHVAKSEHDRRLDKGAA